MSRRLGFPYAPPEKFSGRFSTGYNAGVEPHLHPTIGRARRLGRRRTRIRHLDPGCCGGDNRGAPRVARRAISRTLPRRGAILVLGAASGSRLLLEAAAGGLADRADD